jgi:hypothetical protein
MAQIGTVEFETQNSSTVELPVYETGDFGPNVYDYLRVQTETDVGAIPITNVNDASYEFVRFQTNSHDVTAAHHCPVDKDSTYPVSDGFEDGDINEWTVVTEQTGTTDDPTIEVTTSTVHSGSYSLDIYYPNQDNTDFSSSKQNLYRTFEETTTSGEYIFWARNNGTESQDDFRIRWSGLNEMWAEWNLNREQTVGNGNIYINSTDVGTGLSGSEFYQFIIRNVDFLNETFDWEITDESLSTVASGTGEPFNESACACDTIEIETTSFNDTASEFYIDDIEIVAP